MTCYQLLQRTDSRHPKFIPQCFSSIPSPLYLSGSTQVTTDSVNGKGSVFVSAARLSTGRIGWSMVTIAEPSVPPAQDTVVVSSSLERQQQTSCNPDKITCKTVLVPSDDYSWPNNNILFPSNSPEYTGGAGGSMPAGLPGVLLGDNTNMTLQNEFRAYMHHFDRQLHPRAAWIPAHGSYKLFCNFLAWE